MTTRAGITATLLFTMVGAVGAQEAAAPLSVRAYYAAPVGLEYKTVRTVRRDGQVVRRVEATVTVLRPVTIDGRELQLSRSDVTMSAPSGTPFSGSIDVYQDADDERACTYATASPGAELETYDCKYLDLKGPVKVGASWRCEATTPLDNFEVPHPVPAVLESRVEGLESVEVSGVRFEACAVVSEQIRAAPDEMITCHDGERALTNVEIRHTRVFCPGLPDSRFSGSERYLRRADATECTRFEVESKIVTILNPALLEESFESPN